MNYKTTFVMVLVVYLLVASFGVARANAYSSNHNAIVGKAPSDCSTLVNPSTTIDFSALTTTTISSGNQWSTQSNGYVYPNVMPSGFSLNFVQYNMAIDIHGNVYGSVEYWAGAEGSIFNMRTSSNLDTVNHVQANDNFYIDLTTDSNHAISKASFYYYRSGVGLLGPQVVTLPSGIEQYGILLAWQLNIVGENHGSDPNANFNSGSGTIYQFPGGTAHAQSGIPSCAQSPYDVTSETSNMIYGTPSVSGSSVTQSFLYS